MKYQTNIYVKRNELKKFSDLKADNKTAVFVCYLLSLARTIYSFTLPGQYKLKGNEIPLPGAQTRERFRENPTLAEKPVFWLRIISPQQ